MSTRPKQMRPSRPPDPNLTGQTLGNVVLLEKIGEGSMGTVYRGYQTNLSRSVAVKVVFSNRFDRLITAERFRQEAEIVANLEHPNIVSIFEFGEKPDLMFFVMQLVDGISMGSWLRNRKRHPIPRKRRPELAEIINISRQCLDVLQYAHERKVVHRDIKPENIMYIEKQRRVTVTDFGLASAYQSMNAAEKAFVLGSPLYVSPEQARGEEVDGRADLFSLACVLLEMTLGFLPVKVERPEKIFRTRAKESPDMFTGTAKEHLASIPDFWNGFLQKALAPKRADRFQDAGIMMEALDNLVAIHGVPMI